MRDTPLEDACMVIGPLQQVNCFIELLSVGGSCAARSRHGADWVVRDGIVVLQDSEEDLHHTISVFQQNAQLRWIDAHEQTSVKNSTL